MNLLKKIINSSVDVYHPLTDINKIIAFQYELLLICFICVLNMWFEAQVM